MIRFLLDTDHLTLQEYGHPPLQARLASVLPNSVGISAVSVEEVLRGRLALLSRRTDGPRRIHAYGKLVESVHFFSRIPILPFDQSVDDRFQALLALRLRVGSQDLKIAATALVHHLTLVTRNRRDFEQIPGLVIEDWSEEGTAGAAGTSADGG